MGVLQTADLDNFQILIANVVHGIGIIIHTQLMLMVVIQHGTAHQHLLHKLMVMPKVGLIVITHIISILGQHEREEQHQMIENTLSILIEIMLPSPSQSLHSNSD